MDTSIAHFSKGERPHPAWVIAPLLYLGRCPDVPVTYVGEPPLGAPASSTTAGRAIASATATDSENDHRHEYRQWLRSFNNTSPRPRLPSG